MLNARKALLASATAALAVKGPSRIGRKIVAAFFDEGADGKAQPVLAAQKIIAQGVIPEAFASFLATEIEEGRPVVETAKIEAPSIRRSAKIDNPHLPPIAASLITRHRPESCRW